MYCKIYSVKVFTKKPHKNLTFMYSKVVVFYVFYLIAKEYLEIIIEISWKIKTNNFHNRKCIGIYSKCIGKLFSLEFFSMMPP